MRPLTSAGRPEIEDRHSEGGTVLRGRQAGERSGREATGPAPRQAGHDGAVRRKRQAGCPAQQRPPRYQTSPKRTPSTSAATANASHQVSKLLFSSSLIAVRTRTRRERRRSGGSIRHPPRPGGLTRRAGRRDSSRVAAPGSRSRASAALAATARGPRVRGIARAPCRRHTSPRLSRSAASRERQTPRRSDARETPRLGRGAARLVGGRARGRCPERADRGP
jgi:hypothetical protein